MSVSKTCSNICTETCLCVCLSLHDRCLCWKERCTGKGVHFLSTAALSWYRHQLIHFDMMRRAYDGVYLLVVMILTTGIRLEIANDISQTSSLSCNIINKRVSRGAYVNQHGLMSIIADSYLTISLHVYRWKMSFNQLTQSDVTSLSSLSSSSSNQKYYCPPCYGVKNTKSSANFTLPLHRYITSQSWQRSAHPSEQNEHVAAPFDRQHHTPSQPQAAARRGGQNYEQEFNCEFDNLIKLKDTVTQNSWLLY